METNKTRSKRIENKECVNCGDKDERTIAGKRLCKKCAKYVNLTRKFKPKAPRDKKQTYMQGGKKATLCISCNNVVPIMRDGVYITGCEWSINDKEVEGWDADETVINQVSTGHIKEGVKSYCVKSCPKFTPYIRAKEMQEMIKNESNS